MSDSKPEKVDITIGKKPDNKKTKPASQKTSNTPKKNTKKDDNSQSEQTPEIINFRHKRAGTSGAADTGKDKTDQDKKEEPNLWQRGGHRVEPGDSEKEPEPNSKSGVGHAVLDHPDVKNLDGGFAADMYPAGHTVAPEKEEEKSDDDKPTEDSNTPEEPKAKPESKTADKPPEEDEKKEDDDPTAGFTEDDTVYAHDEDFYSSKFNPDQPDKNRRGGHHGSSGKGKRPWLLFGLFLLTAAAGIAVLYYLESQETGSGLIFDLIEQISIR